MRGPTWWWSMPAADRQETLSARLRKLGSRDPVRTASLLESPALTALLNADDAVDDLGLAADPDLAVHALSKLSQAPSGVRIISSIARDADLRASLLPVLGVSVALGEHVIRHSEQLTDLAHRGTGPLPDRHTLRSDLLRGVGADPHVLEPVANVTGNEALDALRVEYRRHVLSLASRDLDGAAGMEQVGRELADIADAVLEAALAIGRAELPADSEPCRLAIIGLGKCGARELNYVSDVDVVFVAEPLAGGNEERALVTATRLARSVINACVATTAEGTIWEVDAGLRPEGKSGALVRTLASHVAYYERWAKTWEFQALLKARPSAGDLELGSAYVEAMLPGVWSVADRDDFVTDVQAMRRRVEEHVPAGEVDREIKLGPGGLRDVEFAVQLLQLVHGRSDVMLRSPTTLTALEALATWGYVGRDDAATLASAYRFQRTLEHRLQLRRLRRTHLLPDDDDELRVLGRSLGLRVDPATELIDEWKVHQREVRRLHEKLFYRPLLQAVARLDSGEARLTTEAAGQRLEALGYLDPEGALRHLEALTSGVSRRAAIQRTLLPVLLGWFADTPSPDAALLGFRRVSDTLGATPWYLRLLRDESLAAQRLAMLLGSSRLATDLLMRSPDSVSLLARDDELMPRDREALVSEALSAVARQDDPVEAITIVRGIRRRELFRVSSADVLGLLTVEQVGQALTNITAATVIGGLHAAVRSVCSSREASGKSAKFPTRFAIIAMGRLGGGECGYGSDADVMFVHEPDDGADPQDASEAAFELANELRSLLMTPSTDPPLEIDADLRPDGRQGPLVRSLESYATYYKRWSAGWESQALLRAAPLAGDPDLGDRFMALIAPLRYPDEGLTDAELREIRRLKARMEAERLPRGADPTLHTKLGRGGLSDVEWTVQTLQLQYAHRLPNLQVTGTLSALLAEVDDGLVDAADASVLRDAWNLATRMRNAIMLVRGKAGDSVPLDVVEGRGVAHLLGYPPGATQQLIDDYRRVTRRARLVVEREFYA